MRYFILTFIGDDEPGFVRSIAEVIANGEGNWLKSRMSQLDGKFAGLARISVQEDKLASLKEALVTFSENKFALNIEDVEKSATAELNKYRLSILGNDRPGIVHEVTATLASHQINLLEMSSNVSPAAMTGAPMFSCDAIVEVATELDISAVDSQLTEIADELGVDIQFDELSNSDEAL
jgi:glycine cleavage system regulatory protein